MTTVKLLERLGDDFFKALPKTPGVYLLLGDDDRLLYVGKAKNLRTRLRSYTRLGDGDQERLIHLIAQVRTIRWEELASESDAIARETELLRTLRPPFNAAHTDPTGHRAIALAYSGRSIRFWLTDNPIGADEVYGCFAFSASVIDGYGALMRLLFMAQPDLGRLRVPAGVTRASGYTVTVADELHRPLRALLAGTSPKLLTDCETRITSHPAYDPIIGKAVARDLPAVRRFYELGPRALRRMQRRHGVAPGPMSPDELARLLAADLESQLDTVVKVDRQSIEARIVAMNEQGLTFGVIADRLNAERIPKVKGGGTWTKTSVADVLRDHIARATRARA